MKLSKFITASNTRDNAKKRALIIQYDYFFVDKIIRNAGASLKERYSGKGYEVEERPISIDEIIVAHQMGDLQEVFGTGTAAVIAKISKIKYKDTVIELPTENKIGTEVKAAVDGIRAQTVEDKFGWVVPVEA